jgi:Tfp pilus assembly protein PilX
MKNKGVTLILVIVLILMVVVLANIALVLVRSQFRFTHHQVSRIQAFYAAQAGTVYALERLRLGTYVAGTHCLAIGDCTLHDGDFPICIHNQDVNIIIEQGTGPNGTDKIKANAVYTYTP